MQIYRQVDIKIHVDRQRDSQIGKRIDRQRDGKMEIQIDG